MIGKMSTIEKVRVSDIAQALTYGTADFNRPFQASKFPEADKLHDIYGNRYGTFPIEKLDVSLRYLSRFTGNILVIGRPDGIRMLDDKTVSIVEIKTIWGDNPRYEKIQYAIYQIQLYAWLVEPQLKRLGYEVATSHTLLIVNRQNGEIVMNITVGSALNPEEMIWQAMYLKDNKEETVHYRKEDGFWRHVENAESRET